MVQLSRAAPPAVAAIPRAAALAAPAQSGSPSSRLARELEAATRVVLRSHAQILFSRSELVGLLLVCATAMVPRALAGGLSAIVVAMAAARLLGLDEGVTAAGDYGYPALLVGLGVVQSYSGSTSVAALVVLGATVSVLVTAALRSWLASRSLPVLSLPFVATLAVVSAVAAFFPLEARPHVADASALAAVVPGALSPLLRSLGGLFFLPRVDAGAFVLTALLVHSRIGASLAVSAFALASALVGRAVALPPSATLEVLGYNAVFTALALGGVYFVPSRASFALGLSGAALSVSLGVALSSPLERLGLSPSILPFNVTTLGLLLALRQRTVDARPKAVDFLPGTPEENLAYYRSRRSRFQWLHPVSFRLPVRGRWVVTQGEDGEVTHQGPWRHAFDLEVRDAEGSLSRGSGGLVEDYHCFRLPVLAAAAGTVVALRADVPDNAVGGMDLERNWGNHVIVQHAPGLHSLVAHLACGSVKVAVGQVVRAGDVLGLCGSSGRSPRPHVHFQLQATAELGAPTLPCRFTDVVHDCERGSRVVPASLPGNGDVVRNLEPGDEVPSYVDVPVGARLAFRVGGAVERLAVEVDLMGNLVWRSLSSPATLFLARGETFLSALDVVGSGASVLQLVRMALPRLPLEAGATLSWTDQLPARPFRPWPLRVLWDVLSPFAARDALEVVLTMRREGSSLVIEGQSVMRSRRGVPLVRTRAVLSRGEGPVRLEVTVRGVSRSAERVEVSETREHGGES